MKTIIHSPMSLLKDIVCFKELKAKTVNKPIKTRNNLSKESLKWCLMHRQMRNEMSCQTLHVSRQLYTTESVFWLAEMTLRIMTSPAFCLTDDPTNGMSVSQSQTVLSPEELLGYLSDQLLRTFRQCRVLSQNIFNLLNWHELNFCGPGSRFSGHFFLIGISIIAAPVTLLLQWFCLYFPPLGPC